MMDRALKERIIGAVVIVLFVVLVVPVFLDGRSGHDEIVTERVPLPGQSEQKSQTIILERDRDAPVPAVANSAPVVATAEPAADAVLQRAETVKAKPEPVATTVKREPAVTEPDPEPATANNDPPQTLAGSAASGVSTTGMWAVQIGAFSDEDKAERLAADLRKQGFAAFQSPVTTDGGRMVRVRVGPQKDRESAEQMAERLAKTGHTGRVVPHP